MLWECEQKPQSWWSAEFYLIKLCSSLLHKLRDWVELKYCHHYFVSNGNILDHFVEDASVLICKGLNSLANESFLLRWFVENYVRKCAQYCPNDVSVLFEDICFSDKLQRAVDAVVNWKSNTLTQELCKDHYDFEKVTICHSLFSRTDANWTRTFMKELQNFDPRLRVYFVAVTSLRVAYTISMNSLTEDLLEMLWTVFDPYIADVSDTTTSKRQFRGLLYTRRAIKLATLSTARSTAMEMLHKEMAYVLLHYSFVYGQESTYCVVQVLLAALYCKSGYYQSAIDHCRRVLNQCDRHQCCLQCIGAEYLRQTDEIVDAVYGLVLLYQHVQRKSLPPNIQKEQLNKPAFNTQLLAHYFYLKSSTTADSKKRKLRNYRTHMCRTKSPFLCDVLLFKETQIQLGECTEIFAVNRRTQSRGTETDDSANGSSTGDAKLLVTLLELVVLEKLVGVREVLVRELHSEQFPVLNEFEALYSYKCGLLEECLDMCRRNVNRLLRAGCPRYQHYLIVMPEFLSILDGEVRSLFGIILLLRPVYFVLLIELAGAESISLLTLSLYLMVQCQKTLRSDSLCDTLQLIRIVHDKVFSANDNETFFDRLILKLTYRSLKLYIDASTSTAVTDSAIDH